MQSVVPNFPSVRAPCFPAHFLSPRGLLESMRGRRGQGAIEYLLLIGVVLLIIILAIAILWMGVLWPANEQTAGSVSVLLDLTNPLAILATPTPIPTPTPVPTPTPTPTPPPVPGGSFLYQFNGSANNEGAGWSVASGDVDGDGKDDVIIGAPSASFAFPAEGTVRVYSGANGSLLYQFNGWWNSNALGYSLASADVNFDGKDDIIAGGIGGPGFARVFDGGSGAMLYEFVGATMWDRFGTSVAGGDLDGDMRADIVIGSPYNWGWDTKGYARAYSGLTGALMFERGAGPTTTSEPRLAWRTWTAHLTRP